MNKCPVCDSPSPHLHPAVQFEGEVSICSDPFHGRITPENTPARIAAVRAIAGRVVALALALLLLPSLASAAPITLGTWIASPGPNEAGLSPFAQPSEDGPGLNITYLVPADVEYLAGPFRFPGWRGTNVFQLTAYWAEDVFAQTADGTFTLSSPEGFFTSSGEGWQNFLLMRRVLSPTTTQYWVCGEDHDGVTHRKDDCNDVVQTYIETIIPPHGEGGRPVPEPSLFALAAGAAFGLWRRAR